MSDHRARDQASNPGWDDVREGESETERLDRNWTDLLQELRVVQTGVQLLTGFLLTLPFQQRFTVLDQNTRYVYLATIASAVVATTALIAPVAIHRLLFRRHARASIVAVSHRFALVGLVMLSLAVCGVVDVILTLVVDDGAGAGAAAVAATLFFSVWYLLPMALRQRCATGDSPA